MCDEGKYKWNLYFCLYFVGYVIMIGKEIGRIVYFVICMDIVEYVIV